MPKQTNNKKAFIEGYLRDIYKVLTSRKGEDCKREVGLFLYRLYWGEKTGNYEEALNMTLALNAKLDKPHDKNYVVSHTQSAETKLKQGKTYKYSINKIIDVLDITAEEMQELNLEYLYTRTPEERKEHKSKYDSERYIKNLEEKGSKSKKEEIKERAEEVAKSLAQNKSKKEICSELNLSSSSYDRARAIAIKEGLLECAQKEIEVKDNVETETRENSKKITTPKIPPSIVYKNNFVILTAPVIWGWQEEVGGSIGLRE
jgi:hypothetical protein